MKKKEKEKLCSLYIQIWNKIYGPHPLSAGEVGVGLNLQPHFQKG